MKRLLASCLIVALLFGGAAPLSARADDDATPVELSQLISEPLPIHNGRQMLPLRESLRIYPQAEIAWDGEQQMASVTVNGRHMAYTIGQAAFTIDGQSHPLDVPAFLQNDRTYIPLRALVQALDGRIDFTADRRTLLYLPKAETPAPTPAGDLKEALYRFSAKTTAPVLDAGQEENQTYSPISLYMALSLLTPGSNGQTAAALNQFLGVQDAAEAARWNNELLTLQKDSPALFFANSIWIDDEIAVKDTYRDALAKDFHSENRQVDLQKPEDLNKISKWISEKTRDRIKVAFKPQDSERLKLINALYFKDKWVNPFNTEFNVTKPFTRADGQTVSLSMMTKSEHGAALRDEAFTAASLPYENGGQMIFVLPEKGQSTRDLLKDDRFWTRIANFKEKAEHIKVLWTVPPFHLDSKFDLEKPLAALGLAPLFGDADFSGISDEDLNVSAVTQFTDLRLDNEGTEAAAVTIIGIETTSLPAPEESLSMTLDRPFIFILVDQNQMPLFIGEIAEPKA